MRRFPPRKITITATSIAALTFGFSVLLWQRSARLDSNDGSRLVPSAQLSQIEKLESQLAIEAGTDKAQAAPTGVAQGFAKETWSASASHALLSTPAVTPDRVLVGSQDGTLEVWSRAAFPKLLYRLVKRAPISSTPLVHDGIAYIGEGYGDSATVRLTALDIRNARVLWEREFHGHIESAPLLDDGTLYFGAGSGGVWAVQASNGRVVWHAPLGHADSTPIRIGDLIYSPTQTMRGTKMETQLVALDVATAEVRWRCRLPGQPWGSPLRNPDGNDVLVTTAQGQVGPPQKTDRGWSHGIDSKTGKLHWTMELPAMPLMKSALQVEKQLLIHTLKTGEIVAVQLGEKSGSHAWTANLHSRVQAAGTVIDGRWLAVVTESGTLAFRDIKTGKEVHKLEVGKEGSSSSASDGSDLFVVTPGALTAFHLKASGIDSGASVMSSDTPSPAETQSALPSSGTTDTLESSNADRSTASIAGAEPGPSDLSNQPGAMDDDPEDEQLPETGE